VQGPTGPAGQDATGTPGKDGTDGQDGSPPAEWTYADQYGNTYRCTPVDDFDPDNPRYQCTQTATASPTPSEPGHGNTSTVGLLPLSLIIRRIL
jgi:hypothetical protein